MILEYAASPILRNGLGESKDFVILPKSAWDLLVSWYTCLEGNELQRFIYSDPFRSASTFFLDLYPEKRQQSAPIPYQPRSSLRSNGSFLGGNNAHTSNTNMNNNINTSTARSNNRNL